MNLVDGSQVAGALIGAAAFVLSLYGLYKSKRDIAKERSRQFQLDVLRDISNLPRTSHQAEPGSHLGSMLLLLGTNAVDFPMTRAALHVGAAPSEIREFDTILRPALLQRYGPTAEPWDAERISRLVDDEMNQWGHRWNHISISNPGEVSIFVRELNEAINRRVNR